MTTYELYINDILCDLSSDEVVTLLYQSPIFSSLDSIQSNRSYNIGLPPTPTNMQAIGQAARADVDADAPYVRLPAALYQDGVPLFTQGFAVVTDIADTINVTLTWGNADNFQPLFDSNLRDLGPQLEEAGDGHIEWNENTTILEKSTPPSGALPIYPDVAFWGIDFGMGLSNPKYLHPAIDVWRILNAIQQAHGITIEDYQRLYGSLELSPIVPLMSKNGDSKVNYAFKSNSGLNIGYGYLVVLDGKDQANIISEDKLLLKTQDINQIRVLIQGDDGGIFSVKCKDTQLTGTSTNTLTLSINGYPGDGSVTELYNASANFTATNPVAYFSPIDKTFEVANFEFLRIQLITKNSLYGDPEKLNGFIEVWGDYPNLEVIFPSVFPIAANLPDISQGDFILALMSMNGLFAYADKNSPNTIKLISIDDIIANVQNNDIIDWSDRVILNDIHRVDMPDASVFTIDDLAQSNILDYDNDDDVKTDTHGTITIRNENIEKEAELVSLPFSASENITTSGVNCALIPIYEDDGKGGANYSECSPRILAWKDDQTYNSSAICTGRFDTWMKFGGEKGIVKARYASYQKVVDRLRLITVRAKLTALDLYNIDYTKPVYIAQFGQIFAIYSVETSEYGICDCQLLKLKVDGVVPVHYYLYLDGQNADQSKTDITSAGTPITYSVQSNGTPYVVSKDNRLTVTLQTAEDGTILLTINVPQNTSDADIDYDPVILGVSEAYWVSRKVSISQLRAGYGVNLLKDSESITFDPEGGVWGRYNSVATETFEGYKCAVVRDPVLRVLNGAFCLLGKYDDNHITEGSYYTASAYVWANEPVGIRIGLENSEGFVFIIDSTMTGKWIRLSSYQKAVKYNPAFVLYANPTTSTTVVAFRMAQLERGDKLTEWKESIADKYYLSLDGIHGDVTLQARDVVEQLRVAYNTNGTLQLSNSGDVIGATEVDGAYINIYTRENTSPEQRTGTVTLTLQEAPSIVRKIVVIQSGVTTYTPSVTFSQALPWNSESALLSMTNNGDVDLQVISIPDWFLYTAVPHDLAQGEDFAFGISQNTTGELRSGTVGMRYQDATGQYVDYTVQVQQAAAERMVIIDVHSCGVYAGDSMGVSFELGPAAIYASGTFTVGDDLTIRVSFKDLSSMLNEDLENYAGERLYIESMENGEYWEGAVPDSGNIEAELV